ncbi:Protein crossbronx-like protein [Smittium culicis]|uniref:Protein crossbronx-like protein n=1 Tax=Smittium culicis TaxID=133412 RepID=A0A1R1YLF1_9FUNG|nr:Protein crossbronx-like protein [Smittium culicis]
MNPSRDKSKLHNKKVELSKIRLNTLLKPIPPEELKSPKFPQSPSLQLKKKFLQSYQSDIPESHLHDNFGISSPNISSPKNLHDSNSSFTIPKPFNTHNLKPQNDFFQADSKRPKGSYEENSRPLKKINSNNITFWYGCLFLYHGFWNQGVFKFKIVFPNDYPYVAPEIYFMTKVSHPLVDPKTGFYNLKAYFPQWIPYEHYLFTALAFMKNSFNNSALNFIKPESCLNLSSFDLLKNNTNEFIINSKRESENSRSDDTLYKKEDDNCTMVFNKIGENDLSNCYFTRLSFIN